MYPPKLFSCFILILFSMALFSCKNDHHHHAKDATITIISPTEGQVINQGDTVHINAVIVGEEILHGYEVYLRKKSDNSEIYSVDNHLHQQTIEVHEHWVNNVDSHTEMVLEISVSLDHGGNKISKMVEFHCHP